MYDPFQSPQNNWGTYGEDDEFDIFVLGKNKADKDMLKHAPLGSASPVEVREAESVNGPLAILDEYYGVYVTCPDDAKYRLDWIKDYFTPDVNEKYVYPNVFMTREDTEEAPVFPKVWAQIEPLIEGLPLVAHNKPFDEGCLKAVFRVYQMDYPDYEFYDTLRASRRVLPYLVNHHLQTVAAACGFYLENHHHALADAEACAWIAREIL
jgi:hypothetical protein